MLLSLAIICGLIGFGVHTFWIAAIVLMVLGWSYLAADLAGARAGPEGVIVAMGARKGHGAEGDGGDTELTKKELYERARRAGIDGRSKMSKEELLDSLEE